MVSSPASAKSSLMRGAHFGGICLPWVGIQTLWVGSSSGILSGLVYHTPLTTGFPSFLNLIGCSYQELEIIRAASVHCSYVSIMRCIIARKEYKGNWLWFLYQFGVERACRASRALTGAIWARDGLDLPRLYRPEIQPSDLLL